jgi:hypothetical protein
MSPHPSRSGPASAPRSGRRPGIRPDPELPEVATRAQLRRAGLDDRQIDRRLAAGRLIAVRRGVISPRSEHAGSDRWDGVDGREGQHEVPVQVRAALLALKSRTLVVSHTSAAQAWRLPRPLEGWGPVTLSGTAGPTRGRRGVRVTVGPLDDVDVVTILDTPVTSPSRTVADCLRSLAPPDALAIADAAARRGLVNRAEVESVLGRQVGWPGVVLARRLVEIMDGCRESPLESWSAWAFERFEVPAPRWQVRVWTAAGVGVGRVDTWWDEGVAGEADGRAKYALRAAERGGADAAGLARVPREERHRETALRTAGADVVRWGAADVRRAERASQLAHRIHRVLGLAGQRPRFTGHVR